MRNRPDPDSDTLSSLWDSLTPGDRFIALSVAFGGVSFCVFYHASSIVWIFLKLTYRP